MLMDTSGFIPETSIVMALKLTINAIGDIDNPCSAGYIADLLHHVIYTKKYQNLSFYFKDPCEELIEADKWVDLVFETSIFLLFCGLIFFGWLLEFHFCS